ncbi:ketosteroid isomerase [Bradyrhizobium sp. CCBAU 65884]|uniref:nuclear transport factor 2 family protein n=1 Tax=Bradyrhizobium sp. CCBAU 65884 TaxID=722477 RepID=UPI002305A051|nr:nuclear transport factor 2 family protein [Bradyrhizobium sp. CCBAU 65884]MDA9476909.1 ketosteroid isomerase [Bradyrhizobium sp. CCBAU 65884]
MTEHCYWRFSRALHRAINDQSFAEIEGLLHENVEWALYGPVDMFPFLGSRHGKDAVLEVIRHVAGNIQLRRFDRETTILGLDSAASILRCSLLTRASKKPIALRLAQFAQFEAARLINMRALIDTFDLVEQALGRSIHLPNIGSCVAETR